MSTFTISVISIIISGLSVIVSIISFASNRSLLIFFNSKDIKPMPIAKSEISALSKNDKNDAKKVPFPEGLLYHVQVFNPSPKDIAYFHMEYIFDNTLHKDVWTHKTLGWFSEKPTIVLNDPIYGPGEIFIPNAPHGVFKSHSYTPLYCFVRTDEHPFPKSVIFRFKYAVRTFPFIGKKSHYKTFVRNLDISNVHQEIQSKTKIMKQLTQSMPQSPKSKQTPPYRQRHKIKRKHKDHNK